MLRIINEESYPEHRIDQAICELGIFNFHPAELLRDEGLSDVTASWSSCAQTIQHPILFILSDDQSKHVGGSEHIPTLQELRSFAHQLQLEMIRVVSTKSIFYCVYSRERSK